MPPAAPVLAGARATVVTQWGTVAEPMLPSVVCATLSAKLKPVQESLDQSDEDPSNSQPDTQRIQAAISACPAGQAVKLISDTSGSSGFLSGPLVLKSGVQLWVDEGVTLFASRNPVDYDDGSGACGTATSTDASACAPFILAKDTAGSGVLGNGTIDGRGGSILTSGPNAGRRSWWDVAYQNKSSGLHQQVPRLLEIRNGSNFTLYRTAVVNSPGFHVVPTGVTGVTAWGIKIVSPTRGYTRPGYACPEGSTPDVATPATCFTPETVKNTDGFDPMGSKQVLLAYSYVSVGDDHVAIKANGKNPSTQLAFLHNRFYYGHGMSIGSETYAGLSDVMVNDLSIDGFDSAGGIGLRIKSDSTRGGNVSGVTYSQICMRGVRQPLVFDSFYSSDSGTRYPSFSDVKVRGLRNLGSAKYGGGQLTFAGYEVNGQKNPLGIALDNVVFDVVPTFAAGHNGGPSTLPAATHFVLGPGAVSFASSIVSSDTRDVTVTGLPGASTPVDCSEAFVPLSSVLTSSPSI
ncbi:glycoside hydrolase family 28 protein [Variovorax guangxiensis]|uniref:Glycoside hydrolase family 28 protein n=1 Tax=Variovorax guangxiensis TaxID=1775474 RepID=A0A3S0XE39_9BURK|nr:glycoside hydrolase family 28 protein [Variovorax guangxiensis]